MKELQLRLFFCHSAEDSNTRKGACDRVTKVMCLLGSPSLKLGELGQAWGVCSVSISFPVG